MILHWFPSLHTAPRPTLPRYNVYFIIWFVSKWTSICIQGKKWDRAERHDFWSRFLLFILFFLFPPFLGGKRKGEENNQSRGQKSCLSARSKMCVMWTELFAFRYFFYIGKLSYEHFLLQNNLCEFTTLEHEFEICFLLKI
jgi:hypothetical protein